MDYGWLGSVDAMILAISFQFGTQIWKSLLILLSPNQGGILDYCCHEPTSLVRSLRNIYAAADGGNSDGLKQGLYLKQI
jgi:hypothetical protein